MIAWTKNEIIKKYGERAFLDCEKYDMELKGPTANPAPSMNYFVVTGRLLQLIFSYKNEKNTFIYILD